MSVRVSRLMNPCSGLLSCLVVKNEALQFDGNRDTVVSCTLHARTCTTVKSVIPIREASAVSSSAVGEFVQGNNARRLCTDLGKSGLDQRLLVQARVHRTRKGQSLLLLEHKSIIIVIATANNESRRRTKISPMRGFGGVLLDS